MTPQLSLSEQLCYSLYSASIAINRLYKPLLDELGLTYPQYLVLSALWESDGQAIGAIAQRLALEPSTITPLVKRLELAGFVSRERSVQDERMVHARLTAQGRKLQSRAGCLTDELLKSSGMKPNELIALNQQINKLKGSIQRKTERQR
jgi:DNA-binding MarR family transcriptional regulator